MAVELVVDKTKIVVYKSQSNVGGVITPVFRLSVDNELKKEVYSPDEIKLKIQQLLDTILAPTN